MADTMTCPLCGRDHPAGTTYCDETWAEIPVDPPPEGTTAPEPRSARPSATQPPLTCPSCGDTGPAGSECRQCGEPLPSAPTASGQPFLEMPSGQRITIPSGEDVVIGRESNVPELSAALAAFDQVSRRHCLVTVDAQFRTVSLRDLGSTNRTWADGASKPLSERDPHQASLPVRIRLGRELSITVGV